MELLVSEVASLLRSASGAGDRMARSYSIDSRTLVPGALFFAVRGPRFDGHDFVGQAVERGAVGAVVGRDWAASAPANLRPLLIPVADTVAALQTLGRDVRRKWGGPLVAVTGSTGKTTTKELIAAVLGTRYAVHKSAENLNNHLGVPLTLLGLDRRHEAAVVELGMSHAGEIAQLARIAEPGYGVVTNVAPAHLEFFESLEGIASAKRELVENLAPPGVAVLNYDDVRVRCFREGFPGRVVTYGFAPEADFQATDFHLSPNGQNGAVTSVFGVRGPEYETPFRLPLPGRHNVENALAAIAVGHLFGVPAKDLGAALRSCSAPPLRTEVIRLPNGVTVINDCYNSNPRAMEQMLDLVREWPGADRRIVVAGEMLELGRSSPEWHRLLGRKCAESNVDWLLAVQGDARMFVEGAVEAGISLKQTRLFDEAGEAGRFCRSILQPGDVVLVKGSRGAHLEKTTAELVRPSDQNSPRSTGAPEVFERTER
jgi:UDP-N-acetylmuramoyl-tripeptide--D-alanyl-D-alanine ligase